MSFIRGLVDSLVTTYAEHPEISVWAVPPLSDDSRAELVRSLQGTLLLDEDESVHVIGFSSVVRSTAQAVKIYTKPLDRDRCELRTGAWFALNIHAQLGGVLTESLQGGRVGAHADRLEIAGRQAFMLLDPDSPGSLSVTTFGEESAPGQDAQSLKLEDAMSALELRWQPYYHFQVGGDFSDAEPMVVAGLSAFLQSPRGSVLSDAMVTLLGQECKPQLAKSAMWLAYLLAGVDGRYRFVDLFRYLVCSAFAASGNGRPAPDATLSELVVALCGRLHEAGDSTLVRLAEECREDSFWDGSLGAEDLELVFGFGALVERAAAVAAAGLGSQHDDLTAGSLPPAGQMPSNFSTPLETPHGTPPTQPAPAVHGGVNPSSGLSHTSADFQPAANVSSIAASAFSPPFHLHGAGCCATPSDVPWSMRYQSRLGHRPACRSAHDLQSGSLLCGVSRKQHVARSSRRSRVESDATCIVA